LWHAFEEETHVAKKRLDALWSDYLERYAPTDSHAEVLTLILEARLKRLDIIAECMLRVFVADTETGRLYEDWLADLMRAEEQNVLDLVQQEVPHYSGCFDHEKFALALQLRQQGYKERGDDRVIQLISQRRTASAAGGDAPSSSRPKAAASSLENAGFWRARRAEFDALLSRQREILKLETRDEWLKAYCDFSAEHGEFGRCRVQGGLDGRLISDFDDIATQAAKGLGCPPGVNPLTFWLYNLAQDLLRSSNPQIRHEFSPGGEWGGYIQGLLESSAGYCSRLAAIAERQANDGRLPSAQQQRDTSLKSEATKDLEKNAVEVAERATKRQEVVNQILQTKRWKRGRLATEAGVGKNSVYEYLDGTRAKITDENRKAIAQALDLKPEQLPD
jgi:hypothetical protein